MNYCRNCVLELVEIALFCKFGLVGRHMRFANVCNVRWLPQLPQRAKERWQKQNLSSQSIFQLYVLLFFSILSIYALLFLFLRLAGNGLNMVRAALYSIIFFDYNTFKFTIIFLGTTNCGMHYICCCVQYFIQYLLQLSYA